jgi:hypothetical protein
MRQAGATLDLKTPMDLADALHLHPTPLQKRVFTDLYRARMFVSEMDDNQELTKALAFCLLWQILSVEGSKGTILASSYKEGHATMRWIQGIAMRTNPKLADISNVSRRNTLEFGAASGWNIKFIDNDAVKARRRGKHSRAALILGERSSEITFVEALTALTGAMDRQSTRLLRLW